MLFRPLRRLCLGFFVLLLISGAASAAKVERVVSPAGIEAWLVRDTSLPILSLHFAFRGGAALDPAGKDGLAEMVASLLTEGAGELDSQAFQSAIEERVISLGFSAGLDTFRGSLKTLNEHREEAIRLLALALTKPRFDSADVERVRDRTLTGIARTAEDPDTIARRSWMAIAFPDHPYGRSVRGTPASVRSFGAEDFKRFVAGRLARDNLMIGAVGDITAEELGRLVDKAFADLPAKAAPVVLVEAAPAGGGRTILHRRPVPQAKVLFGKAGLKRDDPDYYAAYVLNYILGGGGFNSRLTTEVREKRGLAYSVYSYLSPLDRAGVFMGATGSENARVGQALEVIRAEIKRMHEEGPTAEEMADAKTYLTGSFALGLDSTGRVAQTLVAMQLDRLGIDYLDRRNGIIEQVSIEDVRRAARRLLDPDQMLVVIVGEPDGIAKAEPAPVLDKGG